jgi:hypothetical protein
VGGIVELRDEMHVSLGWCNHLNWTLLSLETKDMCGVRAMFLAKHGEGGGVCISRPLSSESIREAGIA